MTNSFKQKYDHVKSIKKSIYIQFTKTKVFISNSFKQKYSGPIPSEEYLYLSFKQKYSWPIPTDKGIHESWKVLYKKGILEKLL